MTNLAMLHLKYYECSSVKVCLHMPNMMVELTGPKGNQFSSKLCKVITLYIFPLEDTEL